MAGVLILENAPSHQRGQLDSWHTGTLALGFGSGMMVASVLLLAQQSDPLEVGCWRLAFILALPLGLVARFVRRRVSETSQFLAASDGSSRAHRAALCLQLGSRTITDESLTVSEAVQWCAGAVGHREAARLRQLAAQAHNNKPENDSTRAADIR